MVEVKPGEVELYTGPPYRTDGLGRGVAIEA